MSRALLDLVPARMINEALYCERLMYLEWAQSELADNAFAVDGRAVHARARACAPIRLASLRGRQTSS